MRCLPDMILLSCPVTPATLLVTEEVASRTDEVKVCALVRKDVTFVGDVGAETFDDLEVLDDTKGFVPPAPSPSSPCPGVVDAGLAPGGRLGLGAPSTRSSFSPSRSPDENRRLRNDDV